MRQIYQTGSLFGFFVSILSAFIDVSIFVKRANFKSFVSKEVTYVGFDLCHRQFWKCMSVS